MNIFMTGGTGHTGARVARRLILEGHELTCLSHTPERRKYLPDEARMVEGDADRSDTMTDALRGSDICIHLAHIRSIEHIIQACVEAGVKRMICMSSTRRYTNFECESSIAVIRGEQAVEQSKLDYTIVRPSMIYGSWRDNNISRLVRYFRKHKLFPLLRGGTNLVQPVFVDDLVQAIVSTINNNSAIRRSYTIAGPKPISYRHMIETAAETAGSRPLFIPAPYPLALAGAWAAQRVLRNPPLTMDTIRRLTENKTFEIERARSELSYDPRSFEEGMNSGDWDSDNLRM